MKFLTNLIKHKTFLFYSVLAGLTAVLSLAIAVQAYLGGFSRYLADDFCTSGKLQQLGFWQAQSFWYTNWSGRFSFTFLVTALEQIGHQIVPVLPALYTLLLVGAVALFFHSLSKRFALVLNPIVKFFLAALYIFLLFYTIPGIGQDLYWMTGSATYLAPIILGFLLFFILLFIPTLKTRSPILKSLLGIILLGLAFINSGFSEVATVLQAAILFFVILTQRFLTPAKKWNAWWVSTLVITLTGMAVMILAPGNAVRQNSYPPHPNLISLMVKSGQYAATYTILWFVKNVRFLWPVFTITTLISLWLKQNHGLNLPLPDKTLKRGSALLLAVLFLLVYLCFVPSTWATSNGAEDRVLILPTVFLTLILLVSAGLVGYFLSDSLAFNNRHNGFFLLTALALAAYFVIAVPLFEARAIYSQKPQAAAFAQAWDEREILIQQQLAAGTDQLEVPMIGSNLMGLEHIQADTTHWINICAAEHYQVESIRALP